LVARYGSAVEVDATEVVRREIRLQGCHAYTSEDWTSAIDLIAAGDVSVAPLVTHVEPLHRLLEGFAVQVDKERAMKVVVTP
jgi:threonine dehydrogenase-like Zn-dependent dehydrogenase